MNTSRKLQPQEPRIWSSVIRGLQLPLAEHNIELRALMAAHGISEDDIRKPHGEIPLKKYLSLMEAAAVEANDPLLGVRLARSAGPETLGAIGFLFLSSRTLAEAINNLYHYINLLQGATHAQFLQNAHEIVYTYDLIGTKDIECRQDVEFSMALTARLIRIYGGTDVEISEINFRHSPSSPKIEYERLLKAPVNFEQESNNVCIPNPCGQVRSKVLDHSLSRILQDFLDEELERLNRLQTFSDQVTRVVLQGGVTPPVTASKVAQCLGVSEATFYRRLKAENKTFSDLVGERNYELAKSYLADTTRTVTEIAYMLGFAESASFTRAFARWSNGDTPSNFRKKARMKVNKRKRR